MVQDRYKLLNQKYGIPKRVRRIFIFGNGSRKPRITVGSREEREKERFKEVRKLSSDDALPRLRKAETADTRRLNQLQSLETKGFQEIFCLSSDKLLTSRSTFRSTK